MRDVADGVASDLMSHPPIVFPLDRADHAAPGMPVVVLGTDAVLAALPATAVQLAQACRRAGFASAVPVSWGDELVAHACLEELATRTGPAVCAACPRARERLRSAGPALARVVVPLASPPAAVARYLRRLAGETPLHVTYVGGCPGGIDPAIDAQVAPADFVAALVARGIAPAEQPEVFDDVLPPDRRRHLSLPGGVPAPDALWAAGGRRLVEISGPDEVAQLAEHLLSDEPVLIDLAPAHGCACSGATGALPPRAARLVVEGLEPPRASGPIVDPRGEGRATPEPLPTAVPAPAPAPARAPAPATTRPQELPWQSAATTAPAHREPLPEQGRTTPRSHPLTPAGSAGRRSPVERARAIGEHPPLARTEDGRLLPRAYVAHRRSLPHGAEPVADAPAPAAAQPASPNDTSVPAMRQPVTTPTIPVPTVPPPARATPVSSPVIGSIGPAVPPAAAVAAVATGAAGDEWHARLDEAIAAWRRLGFRTAVLERARGLPHRPDVDGLLAAYAAAVERLRALEATAVERRPELRGAPAFHDPERVGVAQTLVDALLGTARRG